MIAQSAIIVALCATMNGSFRKETSVFIFQYFNNVVAITLIAEWWDYVYLRSWLRKAQQLLRFAQSWVYLHKNYQIIVLDTSFNLLNILNDYNFVFLGLDQC